MAYEQFVTSNWIVKNYHFLYYVEKRHFLGDNLLAGSFDVKLEPISEKERIPLKTFFEFDIKNMV